MNIKLRTYNNSHFITDITSVIRVSCRYKTTCVLTVGAIVVLTVSLTAGVLASAYSSM